MNKKIKSIILKPMDALYHISPEFEIKLMFFLKHKYKLNLKNPTTFNEKLNWMKLFYRDELMPICSDKYTVRKYVEEKGLGEILTNLLWVGEDAKQIPFDELPDQFVIKVTHGAGNNIICNDKTKLNRKDTVKKVNRWLKEKYLPSYGEWYYGIIKPRIIIEEYLSSNGVELPMDFKLYCFNNINGRHDIGMTAVYKGRYTKDFTKTIYNANWELESEINFGEFTNTTNVIDRPQEYDKLIEYAKILSNPFPHARVDFYIINHKIYFGEITFMTGAGYNHITPHLYDKRLGDWINLSVQEKNDAVIL